MSLVGLSKFHYALLMTDTKAAATYGTPVEVPGLISADIKPASSSATLYADNGPYDTDTTLGDITVAIDLADLDLDTAAALLGHTAAKGIMVQKATDVAPYVCILFEALKANGKRRFVKLLKGRFQVPDETTKTKDDKVTFQTSKIEGKFVIRVYDKAWKRTADEDAEGFEAETATGWYASVEPAGA